jgi:hypothetical protein
MHGRLLIFMQAPNLPPLLRTRHQIYLLFSRELFWSLDVRILQVGDMERVFLRALLVEKGERLVKGLHNYLYTTGGPIAHRPPQLVRGELLYLVQGTRALSSSSRTALYSFFARFISCWSMSL